MSQINLKNIDQITIDITEYDFNTIELNGRTDGHSMVKIGLEIFKTEQFNILLDLENTEIVNFFAAIEEAYFDQQFHNATHGADVMQAVYCLLVNSPVYRYLQPIERLAVVIAAATHDIGHPGLNNTFLANNNHEIFQKFGKESTLEKFHLSTALKMIEKTKIFANLSRNKTESIRSLITELILATDPAKHSSQKSKFLNLAEKGLNLENPDHVLQSLKQAIICADISGQSRKLEIATQWGDRVYEEFFQMGDLELELNLELQKLNDRQTVDVNKGQVGFINFCVKPVFNAWNDVFESEFTKKITKTLEENCQQYAL